MSRNFHPCKLVPQIYVSHFKRPPHKRADFSIIFPQLSKLYFPNKHAFFIFMQVTFEMVSKFETDGVLCVNERKNYQQLSFINDAIT